MKFYKYKQLQRMTFFGYDDLNATDTTSFSRTSVQSRTVATPTVAPVDAVVYAVGPPIVYAAADFEGVAVRFRQQINENGKMLCWHHVIPEMNHNELVGWRKKDPNQAVVLLRNTTDYKRTQMRMEINKEVFKKYTKTIIEIHSKGKSYLERAFYLIHLTDFVSVDLAELNKLDPTEVKVIDYLKGALAKSK